MTPEKAIAWLEAIEIYFQKQSLFSLEDMAIQAYIQNALNAKKIAELIKEMNK